MGRRIGRNPSQTTAIERRRRLMGVSYGDPDFPVPPGWPVGPGGPGTPGLPPIANLEAFWDTRYKSCESSELDNLLDLTGNQHDLRLGNDGYSSLNYDGLVLPGTSGNYAKADEEFHRGSVASYYDENGIVREASNGRRAEPSARDKNFVDGERTLLVEASQPNLLLWSEDLDVSPWVKGRTTVSSNVAVAPNGQGTADKVVELVGVNEFHQVQQAVTITANATLAYSIYAKKEERSEILMKVQESGASANAGEAFFNLDSKTVGSVVTRGTASGVAGRIEDLDNGWCRCTLIVNIGNGATAVTSLTFLSRVGEDLQYDGDGVSGLYLWGAQIEQAKFASSYVPTANLVVTRPLDAFAKPFLPDFQALTLYTKFVHPGDQNSGSRVFQIGNGTDGADDPRFQCRWVPSDACYRLTYDNGITAPQTGVISEPNPGDVVEHVAQLNADGSTQLHQSINGGPFESSTTTSPPSGGIIVRDGGQFLGIGSVGDGESGGFFSFYSMEVYTGVIAPTAVDPSVRGDLFSYRPGDEINYWEFSGSAQNYQTSVDGKIETAGYSLFRRGLRDEHYVDGVRTTLLEGAATNRVDDPFNLDAVKWIGSPAGGTNNWNDVEEVPSAVAGQQAQKFTNSSSPFGFLYQTLNASLTGTDLACSSLLEVLDNDLALVAVYNNTTVGFLSIVQFDASDQSFTVSSGATPDTTFVEDLGTGPNGGKLFKIGVHFAGLTTGNSFRWYPLRTAEAALAGSWIIHAAQAEFASTPSSFIEGSREADSFQQAYTAPPQEQTVYVRFIEQGSVLGTTPARILLNLGSDGTTVPRLNFEGVNNNYSVAYRGSAGNSSRTSLITPDVGDDVEFRAYLNDLGALQLTTTLNGGLEISAGTGPAQGLDPAWNDELITLAASNKVGSNATEVAFIAVDIFSGERDLAFCRANRGDLYSYRPGDAVFEPSVTGDLDIQVDAIPDDYSPAATQSFLSHYGDSVNRAFNLTLLANGSLTLNLSENGSTVYSPSSTTYPTTSESVRVTREALTNLIRFYYRNTPGAPWLLFSTTNFGSSGGDLFNPNTSVEVGSRNNGNQTNFDGIISSGKVFSGIDGETAFVADFAGRAGQSEFDMPVTGGIMEIQQGNPDTNTPIWLPYCDQTSYLWLPPELTGNAGQLPNEAALQITGPLSIIADVSFGTVRPTSPQYFVNKGDFATNRGYYLILQLTGLMTLTWSPDGSVARSVSSSVPLSESVEGKRIECRVDFTPDRGDGNSEGDFYYREFGSDVWISLGTGNGTGAPSIFPSTSPMFIGNANAGATQTIGGNYYRLRIWDGRLIDPSQILVLDADFTAQSNYDLAMNTLLARTAQTITIQRAATGYKSTVVYDRGVYALATDDFLFAPDAPGLDADAAQDFTFLGVYRTYSAGVVQPVIMKRRLVNTAGEIGWATWLTSAVVTAASIGDDTTNAVGFAGTHTTQLETIGGIVDRVTDKLRAFQDTTFSASIDIAAIGSLENERDVFVGAASNRPPAVYSDMEFVGGAIVRRAISDEEVQYFFDYFKQVALPPVIFGSFSSAFSSAFDV